MKIYFILMGACLLTTGLVKAQSPNTVDFPKRKMAITVQLGGLVVSPSSALKRHMKNNNLGGSSSSWLGSVSNYPIVRDLMTTDLRFERFSGHWAWAITGGFAEGKIKGKNDTAVDWRSFSLSPQYSFYSRRRITRVSLGPVVQWQETASAEGLSGQYRTRQTFGWGAAMEGAVRFPAHSRLFMELGIASQFLFNQHNNDLVYWQDGNQVTLPFAIHFNQVRTSVGFGVRL